MSLKDTFKFTMTESLFLEAASMNIPGVSVQRKFFDNPNVDATVRDVWEYGGTLPIYNHTPNFGVAPGADYYLCSSDVDDEQLLEITIQDELGNEFTVNVTLQGQTPVKVNDLDNPFTSLNRRITPYKCTRVYRLENAAAEGGDFEGTIYCVEGNSITNGVPDTAADVRAIVLNGNNKTLMSQYTIPNGFYGFFYIAATSITKKQSVVAELTLHARNLGLVYTIEDKYSLGSLGTSNTIRPLAIPQIIPPRTDIVLRATADAACGISGTYQILLIKEEFVGTALETMQKSALNY